MLAIQSAGDNSRLPVFVLAYIDLVTGLPVAVSLITYLPEFGAAVIVPHPIGGQVGRCRYRVGAGTIPRITVVDSNNTFAVCLRQEIIIVAERQGPAGGIATVPVTGRGCHAARVENIGRRIGRGRCGGSTIPEIDIAYTAGRGPDDIGRKVLQITHQRRLGYYLPHPEIRIISIHIGGHFGQHLVHIDGQ